MSANDTDGLLAALRGSFERLRVVSVETVESGGALFLCQADDEPLWHVLSRAEHARIARLEFFPFEQGEAARTRLRGLTPASLPTSRRRVRPNAATVLWTRRLPLFEAGDLDTWSEFFADDFVEVDHASHVSIDRETYLRTARTRFGVRDLKIDATPLASLGERHALYHATYRIEGWPCAIGPIEPARPSSSGSASPASMPLDGSD